MPSLTRSSLLRAPRRHTRSRQSSPGREGSAVEVSRRPHTGAERVRGQGRGRARAPPPCRASSVSLYDEGSTQCFSYRLDPPLPPKRANSWDTRTPPWRGPEGDTGLRENSTTTRPRAPEGRPGALQGHHRGSNEARSHTRAGARGVAAAQPSPPRGGPLAGHTPGRQSKRICCVRRPTAPLDTPRRGTGDQRSGPEATTQPLPSSPSPSGEGERQARGPADRPRRADTFTKNARPSSGTA